MISIEYKSYDGQEDSNQLDVYPDYCPFCHRGITPQPFVTIGYESDQHLQLPFLCPRRECQRMFIAYYNTDIRGYFELKSISQGTRKAAEFSQAIQDLSPSFVKIYQQADIAEQEELLEICGVGYRKALEFLVKDYAIHKHPNEEEKIKKKFLGACIKDYIDHAQIKSMAKRATWLGNDETHYVRTWEGKDLKDLKTLIRLMTHWVEMEAETERYEQEMQE
jgi:hypothetical protein